MGMETDLRELSKKIEAKGAEYDRKSEKSRITKEDWARYGGTGTGLATAALMINQFIAGYDFPNDEPAGSGEHSQLSDKSNFMLCVLVSHLEDKKTEVSIGKVNIDERDDDVKETLKLILRGFLNSDDEIKSRILKAGGEKGEMHDLIETYLQRATVHGFYQENDPEEKEEYVTANH